MIDHLLTWLIFLPAIGAGVVMFVPTDKAVRWTSFGFMGATFLLSLLILPAFNFGAVSYDVGQTGVVQLTERAAWIPTFNIDYFVGIDGLSLPLVILSTFIGVLATIASWSIRKMVRGYFMLLLLLQCGILGVFLSLDLFLFYVFFELSLLPMYFLIGIWGGTRREYAAIKFFLYTLVGSIGLLIAIIGTYLYCGTFDLVVLASPEMQAKFAGDAKTAALVFFSLMMVGFLIKVPSVPVHTWLPDAHVEAPTPISMILAAILLKMGGYGIFRIAYPLFPEAGQTLWMVFAALGVVSIIYGALCAMAQTDFKRLVAYSSVSHMGLVVLGAAMMTETAYNGAIFMMIAHGVISAAMFFIVGVVYDRAHHRDLQKFGGLANEMPVYTGLSAVTFFANLGLPGLAGFVGEVMVLLGSFEAATEGSVLRTAGATPQEILPYAIVACFGVVLTAGYMLWTIQRVFFGPSKPEHAEFPEINPRELTVLTPLALLAIVLGVLPWSIFAFTAPTVTAVMNAMTGQ